ncbi:MAG: GAF domain-containing protein [Acidimicrobiales bacterium]
MALPPPLRTPARATLLVIVLMTITAIAASVARSVLFPALDGLWSAILWSLLAISIGSVLLIRFLAWPLASHANQLETTSNRSEAALSHDETFFESLRQLDLLLESAADEDEVIEVVRTAIVGLDSPGLIELHVIDALDDQLRLVAANRTDVLPENPASPYESLATRNGEIVITNSTAAQDGCPHLVSRVTEPVSAVSVPLIAQNGILGVLHATGPEGDPPTRTAIVILEALASRSALHLALRRSSIEAWRAHIDLATALPTSADLERHVGRLIARGKVVTVATLAIDGLPTPSDEEPHHSVALSRRWLASLLVALLPPDSLIGTSPDGSHLIALEGHEVEVLARSLDEVRTALLAPKPDPAIPGFTISAAVSNNLGSATIREFTDLMSSGLTHVQQSGGDRIARAAGD